MTPKIDGWVCLSGRIRRLRVRAPGRRPPRSAFPNPRDGARSSPGSSVTKSPPRALPGRRTTRRSVTRWITETVSVALVAVMLVLTVLVVVAGVVWLLAWATSWGYVAGFGSGIGATVLWVRFVGWNRTRHLRELLDWIGEDLEARKQADLRHERQLQVLKGGLP